MTRAKNEPLKSEKRVYSHVRSIIPKVGVSTEEISDNFRRVGWIGPQPESAGLLAWLNGR